MSNLIACNIVAAKVFVYCNLCMAAKVFVYYDCLGFVNELCVVITGIAYMIYVL